MSFGTGYLPDPVNVGSGVSFGNLNYIFSAANYADGIYIGRFLEYDTVTEQYVMPNAANPSLTFVVGVVEHSQGYPPEISQIDDASFAPANKPTSIDYVRAGLVTVELLAGVTPLPFQPVYVYDGLISADLGTVTNVVTTIPANAEFIREEKPGVWLIRLK